MTTDIESREKYPHFLAIPTRWMDNDIYGHVNNVVYYSYFDTVINEYLIAEGGFDIHKAAIIGVAVETMCKFRKSLAFRTPRERLLPIWMYVGFPAPAAIAMWSKPICQASSIVIVPPKRTPP